MKTKLRFRCSACGYWNRIEVEKVLFKPEVSEPNVKVFIPMYMPLKPEACKKCGKLIAQPKELIRITKEKE
jgi:ribosomal protein L44E